MENLTPAPASKGMIWSGRVMSALPVLGFVMGGVTKIMKSPPVVDGFNQMGMPVSAAVGLGVLELLCALLYIMPATSILGAILMTGFMGGATFATFRAGLPYWPPVVTGVLVWGGLYLRDPRIRALIPLKK